MNQKQRIVILIGIILVLICGLFPPYEGEIRTSGENIKKEIGYHFLLSSLSAEKIHNEMLSDYPEAPQYEQSDAMRYYAYISTSKYGVQIITIVLVTIGLVFIFKPGK